MSYIVTGLASVFLYLLAHLVIHPNGFGSALFLGVLCGLTVAHFHGLWSVGRNR